MRRHLTAGMAALACVLSACGGDSAGPVPITAVTITPPNAEMAAIGQTVQFSASAIDEKGRPAEAPVFTWESLDPAVLTVDGTGKATALAAGTGRVRVRVTGSTAMDDAEVAVIQRVTSLRLTAVPDSLLVGGSATATAQALDANAHVVPGTAVTWISSDPGVLTVDATGRLAGVARGSAELSARVGTITVRDTVRVLRTNLPLARDTVLSGTVQLRSLRVPANVTLTFSDDVMLDIDEDVEIAGRLTANCHSVQLLSRGNVSIVGTVSNACSDSLAADPGDLVIASRGVLRLDSAEIASTGAVGLTNDVTLTAAAFPVVPSVTGTAAGIDTDGIFARVRMQAALHVREPAPLHAAGAQEDVCEVRRLRTRLRGGRPGVGARVGSNGTGPRRVTIRCRGDLNWTASELIAADGKDGGMGDHEHDDLADAVGGNGGAGGSVTIQATGRATLNSGTIKAGKGGRGARARARAAAARGAAARAASARARAGNGGPGGFVYIFAAGGTTTGQLVILQGAGGDGGDAEAVGAHGIRFTGTVPTLQAGGNANAYGGAGGFSVALGGNGGSATATAGNGAPGIEGLIEGAAGGAMHAEGGRGGGIDSIALVTNRVFGNGGPIFFSGGSGGAGYGQCTGTVGLGGKGGLGGGLTGFAGLSGHISGGTRAIATIRANTGMGGNGGGGIPFGAGGAAGTIGYTRGPNDIFETPSFLRGVDGTRCPGIRPFITTMTPSSVPAGSGAVTLQLTGHFGLVRDETTVKVGNTVLTPLTWSTGELTVSLAPVFFQQSANLPVIAITLDGQSDPRTLAVTTPTPSITAVSPSTITAGTGSLTIGLTGSGFFGGSRVKYGQEVLPTTYLSATSLTAIVPNQTVPGNYPIVVDNSGTLSAPFVFNVRTPVPVITSVSPPSVLAGSGTTNLVISGTGFLPSTSIALGNRLLPTTYNSGTSLSAVMHDSMGRVGGSFNLQARHFDTASLGFPFLVNNRVPTISSVSPSSVAAGGSGISVNVTGTNFIPNSTVSYNEVGLQTTYVSPTSLNAFIPGSLTGGPGNDDLTVFNPAPGGGRSAPFVFTVNPVSQASITLTPSVLSANHVQGVTECDQVISGLVLRNTGPMTITFSATMSGDGRLSAQSPTGSLSPGGQRSMFVIFNCAAAQPVSSIMTVVATPIGGGASVQATARVNLSMNGVAPPPQP